MTEAADQSICFVAASVFDPESNAIGGAERQMWLLGRELAQRGWRIRYTGLASGAGLVDPRTLPGQVTWIRTPRRLKGLTWIVSFTIALLGIPERFLYQRGAYAFTVACWLAARLTGKRFVWAVASDADCAPDTSLELLLGNGSRSPLRRMWWRMIAALIGRAIRGADIVLYQHEGQLEPLVRERGLAPEHLHLLRHAAQMGGEAQTRARESIAWVGSMRPIKRPERFIELAARCAGTGRFVMAGRATAEEAVRLRAQAEQGTGEPVVEILGELAHDEILELMSTSLALVSTSVVEGLPNTWVEAWTMGTPVLSLGLDPGGVLSVADCGWVAGSLEEAARIVRGIVADPSAEWERKSASARAYAAREHTLRGVGDRLESLLGDMTGSKTEGGIS